MHRFVAFALLLVLTPSAAAQTSLQGTHLVTGPDPSTSMDVVFMGPPGGAGVRWGTTTAFDQQTAATYTPLPGTSGGVYVAHLTGLAPDTVYHYHPSCGCGAGVDATFRTRPTDAAPLRIAAWGDEGVPDDVNPESESDGDNPVKNIHNALRIDADVHLVAGDLSYANGDPATWDAYFDMIEPYASTRPFLSAVGNHEREAGQGFQQYTTRMPMPGAAGHMWWTQRIDNVQLIALDSEHACTTNANDDLVPGIVTTTCSGTADPAQTRFLEDTLQAARRDPRVDWILAFHHYPLWSDGPHGSNKDLQRIWGTLYDAYHADVVIQAHDHLYERSKQLVSGTPTDGGTLYVTAGVGGASHYAATSPKDARPAWEDAYDDSHYGALVLDVNGTRLDAQFIGLDGAVLDAWSLEKGSDGRAHPVWRSPICIDSCASPAPTRAPGFGVALLLVAAIVGSSLARRRV